MIALILVLSFVSLCSAQESDRFQEEYQWTFINFTWPSEEEYNDAIASQRYIPENNAMTGIKFYQDKFYIAMPRIRTGVPATLGYISVDSPKVNPLITPYPSWEMNQMDSCDGLQSVQSMEIDREGTMWVIDGMRTREWTDCPPKLILFDANATILQTFIFPDYICLSNGGFLNDIVVDDSDGGFAYISDNGAIDPGLIVYSRRTNRTWKIRDASMFPELAAAGFDVAGQTYNALTGVDGIALSPNNGSQPRKVYYCPLTGYGLYAISTDILKSEDTCSKGDWRARVEHIGAKQAQSDGMVVDNEGTLYYGLLPLYGVGRWNGNEPFSEAEVVDINNDTMLWTDSFGFDDKGYLYLLTNHINRYFDLSYNLTVTDEVMFRILKYFTNTQSYLYS